MVKLHRIVFYVDETTWENMPDYAPKFPLLAGMTVTLPNYEGKPIPLVVSQDTQGFFVITHSPEGYGA